MSAQLNAAKKKKKQKTTQLSIKGFFPTDGVQQRIIASETNQHGHTAHKCRFCGKMFTAQGILAHETKHVRNGDTKMSRTQAALASAVASLKPPPKRSAEELIERNLEMRERTGLTKRNSETEVIDIESVEENNNLKLPGLTIHQKILALNKYHSLVSQEPNRAKSLTVQWAKKEFARPSLSRQTLNTWINNEEEIRSSSGTKRIAKHVLAEQREGQYPEIEIPLQDWIREARRLGLPVETSMLPLEGRAILKQKHPALFEGDGAPDFVEPFQFSVGWQRKFMKRHNFSSRKITTKKSTLLHKKQAHESICQFHLETRVFQMSQMNDPTYGVAPPTCIFNRDQVPIALCASQSRSIDDKGLSVIWNSIDLDVKRFATLNLTIPMRLNKDLSNLPKPHIIFKATKHKGGEDWDTQELELWHPGVHVSFQENAWVDEWTNIYGLKKLQSDLKQYLDECQTKNPEIKAVQFEDNLSSHKTASVMDFWHTELNNHFHEPRFYPPNMTAFIQAIDHHIGRQYKVASTNAVRKRLLVLYQEAVEKSSLRPGEDLDLNTLSAKDKQILLTKSIGEVHLRLATAGSFERAFIATGTWLPIDGSRDKEVSIQGLEYNYAGILTPESIAAYKKEKEEKEAAEASAALQLEQKFATIKAVRESQLTASTEHGDAILAAVLPHLRRQMQPIAQLICKEVNGLYLIGGSFVAHILTKTLLSLDQSTRELIEVDELLTEVHIPSLPANDIDVYVDTQGNLHSNNFQPHFGKKGILRKMVLSRKSIQ